MDFELAIKELVELAKNNNNTVYSNDLLKYCEDETDDYDKLEDAIKERNIDVVPSNDSIDESLDDEEPINLAGVEEVDISDFDKFNFKIDDPVRMYLKDIGKIQLLDIDEETDLAIKVAQGREAKAKLEKLKEQDPNTISVKEVKELEDEIKVAN